MFTPAMKLKSSPAMCGALPRSGRRHVDLAWIGLRVGDQFGNGLGWNRWMHKNDHRYANDARDRCDIADEVEIELLVERRVYGVWDGGQKQGMPVRRRIDDRFGADVAAGSRPILNHEGLSQPIGKPLADQPRRDVDAAS